MTDLGPYEVDTIVVGDCLEVMANMPDGCVDLVVTDPDYTKSHLYLYGYLADECPRIMKDGASLVTIVGHYAIPTAIDYFRGKLKYRWMFCMNQFDGPHARMAMGIEVMWHPMLWYVKRAYPQGRGFIRDGFVLSGKEGQKKTRHKWQKDSSWAEFLISKLSQKGDLVFDPFLGSGTTAVAAQKLGRHYFGCDISEAYVRMSRERLATVQTMLPGMA